MTRTFEQAIPRNVDRLLSELGLERRRSFVDYIAPVLGVLAVGVVVGGLLGLLLAPSSGRELRAEIGKRVQSPTGDDVPAPKPDGVAARA